MISFAQDHRQDYFGRSRDLSVFRTQEWLSLDNTVAQGRFLVERYWQFHERLTFQPRSDGVDLSGITAPVPELLWWLFLFGMIISIIRRPGWFTFYAAAVVLIAPFSAVLTDLVIRRSLIILPFACALAGVGLSETIQAGWRRSRRAGLSLVLGTALILGGIGWVNYDDFFNTTVKSQEVSSVFAVEFRETMEWVRTVPEGHHFILFINNQPVDHEVGQLLVPEIADIAENRLEKWGGTGTYEIDRSKGDPVFVLVGADNIARLPEIQALYPGGEVITGPTLAHQDVPAYVAYFVPEQ